MIDPRHILRTILVGSAMTLLLSSGFSQRNDDQDEAIQSKFAVGLNSIELFNTIFDGSPSTEFPYIIELDYQLSKLKIRLGVGGSYRDAEIAREPFTDVETNQQSEIYGKLGFLYRLNSHPRWQFSAGIDLVASYQYDERSVDSGFDVVSDIDEKMNFGGGPVIDLTFLINQTLSIGTESQVLFRHFKDEQHKRFKNFPEFDDTISTTTGNTLDIIAPQSLFIRFHF